DGIVAVDADKAAVVEIDLLPFQVRSALALLPNQTHRIQAVLLDDEVEGGVGDTASAVELAQHDAVVGVLDRQSRRHAEAIITGDNPAVYARFQFHVAEDFHGDIVLDGFRGRRTWRITWELRIGCEMAHRRAAGRIAIVVDDAHFNESGLRGDVRV